MKKKLHAKKDHTRYKIQENMIFTDFSSSSAAAAAAASFASSQGLPPLKHYLID